MRSIGLYSRLDKTDAKSVTDMLYSIPGDKILTLTTSKGFSKFDVKDNGQIEHKPIFLAQLQMALLDWGVLVVRQFREDTFPLKMANGKTLQIPYKNVYYLRLGGGAWIQVSPEETEYAANTDAHTGEALEREPGVYYPRLDQVIEDLGN
jgi:hypothetical protein